jgi:hypothetical protein
MNNPIDYLGSGEKAVNHFKQMAKDRKWGYFIFDGVVILAILTVLFSALIVSVRAAITAIFPTKPIALTTTSTIQTISSSSVNSPSVNIQSSSMSNSQIFQNNGAVNVNGSEFTPYLNIAQTNWDGLPSNETFTGGLKIETSISDTLGNYVYLNSSSNIVMVCSPSSTAAFQHVISISPKFPYGYYYLGYCEMLLGYPTSTWETAMRPAYDIMKITTQIPNHDATQDSFIKYFQSIYGQ